jgi:hypothetical protein
MNIEPIVPLANIDHGVAKPLPDGAGAIGPGQAAPAHVPEDGLAPVRNDQAVENDGIIMDGGF